MKANISLKPVDNGDLARFFYQPDEVKRIITNWNKGKLTAEQIADYEGRSVNGMRGKIFALQKAGLCSYRIKSAEKRNCNQKVTAVGLTVGAKNKLLQFAKANGIKLNG